MKKTVMKKVIRLTESQLESILSSVIKENDHKKISLHNKIKNVLREQANYQPINFKGIGMMCKGVIENSLGMYKNRPRFVIYVPEEIKVPLEYTNPKFLLSFQNNPDTGSGELYEYKDDNTIGIFGGEYLNNPLKLKQVVDMVCKQWKMRNKPKTQPIVSPPATKPAPALEPKIPGGETFKI